MLDRTGAPVASHGALNVNALRTLALLAACVLSGTAHAALHSLWAVQGRHNTIYLLGSIHVLRSSDYPLAPEVLEAYADSQSLVMEIDLEEADDERIKADMVTSATLPEGRSLGSVLGPERYARASALAQEVGVDLGLFDGFAPWFAAEAISQLQLSQLGYDAKSGVEMYFLDRARHDGKRIAGLETVHDQIELFTRMSLDSQADYLLSSLEQAKNLPTEVDQMVHAWQRGDTAWFAAELKAEFGADSALSRSLLLDRNRKWLPQIEALLQGDKNVLVIVGTGHLAGPGSVIDLLAKDGIGAAQR